MQSKTWSCLFIACSQCPQKWMMVMTSTVNQWWHSGFTVSLSQMWSFCKSEAVQEFSKCLAKCCRFFPYFWRTIDIDLIQSQLTRKITVCLNFNSHHIYLFIFYSQNSKPCQNSVIVCLGENFHKFAKL